MLKTYGVCGNVAAETLLLGAALSKLTLLETLLLDIPNAPRMLQGDLQKLPGGFQEAFRRHEAARSALGVTSSSEEIPRRFSERSSDILPGRRPTESSKEFCRAREKLSEGLRRLLGGSQEAPRRLPGDFRGSEELLGGS